MFETTLSTRSFVGLINQAKERGCSINLIYSWLDSVELAIERVKTRVAEGGHNIPSGTIIRRYYSGLNNFINLYKDRTDYWMLTDNSKTEPELIAEGRATEHTHVLNFEKWEIIKKLIKDDTNRN